MSERERWIVYPLIFFALGAAVRDKLLQRVEAKEIVCESMSIVDLQHPAHVLAELGFRRARPNDPSQLADRVGQLLLLDSDGNDVCEINSDAFFRRLATHLLQVVDPHGQPLVNAGTEPVVVPGTVIEGAEPTVSYQGVIYLNNQPLGVGVRLAPPSQREDAPAEPPARAPEEP
jgi:hypothetical protein